MGNFSEDLMKGPKFARKGGHWWGTGNPHILLKCDKHGEYSKHHDDPDQECPKCKKEQGKKKRFNPEEIGIDKIIQAEVRDMVKYEDLAKKFKGTPVEKTFRQLAADEGSHRDVLTFLKDSGRVPNPIRKNKMKGSKMPKKVYVELDKFYCSYPLKEIAKTLHLSNEAVKWLLVILAKELDR